jgi:hypothetical protein
VEPNVTQKGATHDRRNPKGQDRSKDRTVSKDRDARVSRRGQSLLAGGRQGSGGSPRLPAPAGALDAIVEQLAARVAADVESRVSELIAGALESGRPPRLLDRRGLAEALGCGVDTVDKLRKDGLPTVWVVDSPRFDFAECLAWLKARRP